MEQDHVDHPWVNKHTKIRNVDWFRSQADEFDRVVYQMGNSPFHRHMLTLLQEIPGTVVMHDFYLSSLMHWLERHAGIKCYAWTEALYASHGYKAVRERFLDTEAATDEYPTNLCVLQNARGLIVHSEYSKKLALQLYGDNFPIEWEVIPLLRSDGKIFDRTAARKHLGVREEDFVLCSFGFLSPTKLNHRLLGCWLKSNLAKDKHCRLVFVGELCGPPYCETIMQTMGSIQRR